jgi:HK97 family phage major capsid protein
MNARTASALVAEAKTLLTQARELMTKADVSDADRVEAVSLRERAQKMQSDAQVLAAIEREAKIDLANVPGVGKAAALDGDDEEFHSFGEFVQAVVEAKSTGRADARLTWMARDAEDVQIGNRKALSGTAGATGGYLMPQQFVAQLQALMMADGGIMSRVTTVPMTSRTVSIPVLDHTRTLPEGEPRQFGGVIATYQNEGDESQESEPKFGEHLLTAHELTVYTEANNSLLADSAISLESFLASSMGMSGALDWKIAYKIFRGTGVGQPLGILKSAATITVARETLNSVDYVDLARMDELAMPSNRLMWYASVSLKMALRTLQDPDGNYIWAEAAAGLPATLLGYPVVFTDKLPRIGTTGDILLADMSYYLFGDRQAPSLEASTESSFRRNRTAYRLIHRHDGSPWLKAPLTLADTVTQVSPFVALSSTVS